MKLRRFRPRAAGGRAMLRRRVFLLPLLLLCLLLCLFLLVRLLPAEAGMDLHGMPLSIPAGGSTSSLTVVVTELRASAASAEAGSRLEQALRRREWCTPASPTQSVTLVLVFYAPPEPPQWPRSLPVRCVACGKSDPWHTWTVGLAGSQTRAKLGVAPCVTGAHVVFAHKAEAATKVNYGVVPAMVQAALGAVPRTDYFLLMADVVLPAADDFMQKLLQPLQQNAGRVAAVQCTLLQRRGGRTQGSGEHGGGAALLRPPRRGQGRLRGAGRAEREAAAAAVPRTAVQRQRRLGHAGVGAGGGRRRLALLHALPPRRVRRRWRVCRHHPRRRPERVLRTRRRRLGPEHSPAAGTHELAGVEQRGDWGPRRPRLPSGPGDEPDEQAGLPRRRQLGGEAL
ncbi:mannosyltransferase-like protein [Trypanosoma conorhini]|uniref:Mannosyltransferase-like protein n=1 Tax=Trypanosoma conorhini TaxID=83891 RepID=A0A422QBU0_9TRYP|nr:mannosyltransferase-like protein [Trypanosoma conorhini]RNF27419.1 mannosyltransferase-like protein [Trypanosoma conorhini]